MSNSKPILKFGLLASLYITQFLPIAFFYQTLPVYLRQQGVSLASIGLVNLVTLPWMLKFLWAPLVDRYGWTRWGHYKTWIIAMQTLLAITLIGCAALDVRVDFPVLMVGFLLVCTFAATQDIATDALAIGFLTKSERGIGNGIQTAGGYLGFILGGGVMLILLDGLGWTKSLMILALTMLLALIPVLWHKERKIHHQAPLPRTYFQTIADFFRRSGMRQWLLIVMVYPIGDSMASSMFRPLLVDLQFSLTEIGWILGIVGLGAGVIGAIVAGFVIKPLGRKRSLIIFGLLQAIAIGVCLLPAIGLRQLPIIYLASISAAFTHSLAVTALFTAMMDRSHLDTAGTDYTIQTAAYVIGHMGIPAVSGLIAGAIGYISLFALSIGICLMSVGLVAKKIPAQSGQDERSRMPVKG
jgi:MFS family permease